LSATNKRTLPFTDFDYEVSAIAKPIMLKNDSVTVEEIVTQLDKKYHYENIIFSKTVARVRTCLWELGNKKCPKAWEEYQQTEDYKTRLEIAKHLTSTDEYWKKYFYIQGRNCEIFGDEKIYHFSSEAKVLGDWINELLLAGIIYPIAGKGNKIWRIANLFDWNKIKHQNLVVTIKTGERQAKDYVEDGRIQAEGADYKLAYDGLKQASKSLPNLPLTDKEDSQ
jgi:hypothetical protein